MQDRQRVRTIYQYVTGEPVNLIFV